MTDGAAMLYATLYEGTLGAPKHGDQCRWDWGVTQRSLEAAQQRHARLQALAESLTPEQRMAVWSSDDPRAQELRRYVR